VWQWRDTSPAGAGGSLRVDALCARHRGPLRVRCVRATSLITQTSRVQILAGAGVDVQLLEEGELLVSHRCVTADAARYMAQSFKNDHLRTGWVEQVGEDSRSDSRDVVGR